MTGDVTWEGDPLLVIVEPEFLALRLEIPRENSRTLNGVSTELSSASDIQCILLSSLITVGNFSSKFPL